MRKKLKNIPIMKRIKTRFLLLLAVMMMTATGAKAYDVLYATVSGTNMTLAYGDNSSLPVGAVVYNSASNWSESFNGYITSAVIDPDCANAERTHLEYLFKGFKNLETIEGLEYLNTSQVINMQEMFSHCEKLTSLDLSSWDTGSVTNMGNMFICCYLLSSLKVGSWNTANVTRMDGLFQQCSSLTTLDLSGWNTASVTDMYGMFMNCTLLQKIFVSDDWSTARVTSNKYMFRNCSAIVGEDGTTYDSNVYDVTNAHFGTGGYLRNNYLYDAADNSSRLASWNGYTFGSVKLKGRTLKAGTWNSLCLPFSLDADHIAASFPAGTDIKTLDSYSNDGTNVTVCFTDAATIAKGKPYIVFIPEGSDITDPVFSNVIIQPANVDIYKNTKGDATFIGTCAPVNLAASPSCLFLQNDKLDYPDAPTTINAFRAYFTLANPVPTGSDANIKTDFGEETAIESLFPTRSDSDDAWYTLNGVKLDGKPTAPGIYVCGGKKVVIR